MRKLGRERKETKEGKMVAPAKATFRVSQTKNSFFWFTSIGERPILIEVLAPTLFFYKEAMCKGSSGNRILNAAKQYLKRTTLRRLKNLLQSICSKEGPHYCLSEA